MVDWHMGADVDDLLQYVRETLQVCTAEVAALPRFLLVRISGGGGGSTVRG